MENEKLFEEYKYSNAGQYRAVMQSLGYTTEYNNGHILFSKGKEQFRTKIDTIKAHISTDTDLKPSLERISQKFDADKFQNLDYIDELKKDGFHIVNWGDIGGDGKDKFTVIDHNNKVCYTGRELFDYAIENGYLLDGKGTKVPEKGMSKLLSHNGKPAKVRYTANGISIHYKKERLEIPNEVLGHKLTDKEKQDLMNGERVQINGKKGNVYLEIDSDLNSIIVLSEKELSIPDRIGGYELSNADKYLLANGYSLDNKLLKDGNGYFIADISLTPDKHGISFGNMQSVPSHKAQELLKGGQLTEVQTLDDTGFNPAVKPDFNNQQSVDKYIEGLLSREDYTSLDQLKKQGCMPSNELMKQLSEKISDNKMIAMRKIFGLSETHKDMQGEIKIASSSTPSKSVGKDIGRPAIQTVGRMFSDL